MKIMKIDLVLHPACEERWGGVNTNVHIENGNLCREFESRMKHVSVLIFSLSALLLDKKDRLGYLALFLQPVRKKKYT